ncbi:hypothetical protein ABZ543_07085 [Streptomyces roseifaciens]
MSIVLSTATVPAEDRLDYWYEVISQTYGQLASVRLDIATPTDAPFAGTITADELGPLRVATTVSDPVQVRQKTRGTDGRHDDYLDVCVQESGQLVIDQGDGQTLLRAGSLTLFDTTRPYTSTLPARHRMHVFQVPRSMVGFREAELHRITAVPLGADSPAAALVVPFLLPARRHDGRPAAAHRRHARPQRRGPAGHAPRRAAGPHAPRPGHRRRPRAHRAAAAHQDLHRPPPRRSRPVPADRRHRPPHLRTPPAPALPGRGHRGHHGQPLDPGAPAGALPP